VREAYVFVIDDRVLVQVGRTYRCGCAKATTNADRFTVTRTSAIVSSHPNVLIGLDAIATST